MSYRELVERWGVDINRPLLRLALTHRSFAFEHGEPHNERLEFLGDSVLGFIAADKVFREFPDSREGDMSRMKTFAVSEKALASIARELELGRFIRLGRGEDLSGGRDKDSILSDTVEALIAATYLQHGLDVARKTVERLVAAKIEDASLLGPNLDWQTSFEEVAHERGMTGSLQFELTSEGPDHRRVYTAVASMGGRVWGEGTGSSKKTARQDAAQVAYRAITAENGE